MWGAGAVSLAGDRLTPAHQGECADHRLRWHGREGAVETTAHESHLRETETGRLIKDRQTLLLKLFQKPLFETLLYISGSQF